MKITIKKTTTSAAPAVRKTREPEFIIKEASLLKCNLNGCKVIKVPTKITVIGSHAFSQTDVEEVILPNNINTIGEAAFYQCNNLKKINFPEKLERIKKRAFARCISLESADLPAQMLYIGDFAFELSGLKQITLPEKITGRSKIGEYIFTKTALETVNIPKSFDLERGMFANCHKLKAVKFNCMGIYVPECCFINCENLEKINLGAIDWFGERSFSGCTSLKEKKLTFEDYQHVSAYAFMQCPFTKIYIKDISNMDKGAFRECSQLEEVTINSLTESYVKMGTFRDCSNLKTVVFTDKANVNITNIDASAFTGCQKLTEIKLPQVLKHIGPCAFMNTGVRDITLPDGLNIIGENAFTSTDIEEISIPDSVISLNKYTFSNCLWLKRVYLSKRLTTIPAGCFAGCTELCEIVGTEDIKNIEFAAFSECYSLAEFNFTNICFIRRNAFENSGLKEVKCSSALLKIEKQAFSYCINLEKVDLSGCTKLKTIPEECFGYCNNELEIKLPCKKLVFERRCLDGTKLEHLTIYSGKDSGLKECALFGAKMHTLEFLPDENETEQAQYTGREFINAKIDELLIPDYLYDKYKEIWDSMK